MVGRCRACGFELESLSDDEALAFVAGAPGAFAAAVDEIARMRGDDAVRLPAGDGWSPIEHVLHVTDCYDGTRRQLFDIFGGRFAGPPPHIEAPHVADQDVPVGDALEQLDHASTWLVRSAWVVSRSGRDPASVEALLGRAAHEAYHHQASVAAMSAEAGVR